MNASMDPALSMLSRALQGDRGALSFLDRTTSIYLLDATYKKDPRVYGGWNFIHQAMTELERLETKGEAPGVSLHSLVQLLAAVSQRVARRPPSSDRYLVSMCIENAAQYHATAKEAQSLIEHNLELREIVMGRIAAMVFDFSFHNPNGPHLSAFADPTAMESLCAALAANAVSSGPQAVQEFLVEWIIPSITTLPPFAVACVILHVGVEAVGRAAPAGTKNMLQMLSSSVMAVILGPTLRDAILEIAEVRDEQTAHERNSRVAATSIRAIHHWCVATDLTLPQIKHVVGKVQISIVELISDAMYSDSELVVEAMAEFVDDGLDRKDKEATVDRMNQARYIMNVDEIAFKSISPKDLFRIEATEMNSIIIELISAIGLQRYRFSERQTKGDFAVCRCLTRIAVAICSSAIETLPSVKLHEIAAGMADLLMKAAEHPSVNICGLALEALVPLAPLAATFNLGLLPILQRRAVIPHAVAEDRISIHVTESSSVDYDEFENFRKTILSEALLACWRQSQDAYLQSCTAGLAEFCSVEATVDTSFKAEAALFCIAVIAGDAMNLSPHAKGPGSLAESLLKFTEMLATKPLCVMSSPIGLAQVSNFIRKYASWYATPLNDEAMGTAADLLLVIFTMSTTDFVSRPRVQGMLCEMSSSPFSAAARALGALLSEGPGLFQSESSIKSLKACWDMSYRISNRPELLSIEDREALGEGICYVADFLPSPDNQRLRLALSLPTLDCLNQMVKLAHETVNAGHSGTNGSDLSSILLRVAHEIRVLTVLATKPSNSPAEESRDTSTCLEILKRSWGSISSAAEAFNADENISEALESFLVGCVALLSGEDCVALMKELCTLASSILTNSDGTGTCYRPVSEFIVNVLRVYGESIEKSMAELTGATADEAATPPHVEVVRLLESLLKSLIERIKNSLGSNWARGQEQGKGQQPFESKADEIPDERSSFYGEGLSEVLTILSACALKAPQFLIHLPSDSGTEGLLGPAVDSAVSALLDPDAQTSICAVHFLLGMMELWKSSKIDRVRDKSGLALSGVRRRLLSTLFAGFCGAMLQPVLEQAVELYYAVIRAFAEEEAIEFCAEDLQNEAFLLGDAGGSLYLRAVRSCVQGEIDLPALNDMFTEMWSLHQVDDTGFVAGSDAVLRFVQKYSN